MAKLSEINKAIRCCSKEEPDCDNCPYNENIEMCSMIDELDIEYDVTI